MSAADEVELRHPTAADAAELAELELRCWPADLAATEEQIAQRIRVAPDYQWALVRNEQLLGAAWSQRITSDFLASTVTTHASVTADGTFSTSHDPAGEILQLVTAAVLPEFRGDRLGRVLVDQVIESGRAADSVQRIIGFTRPIGFANHQAMDIDQYVLTRDAHGRPLDPVLAFHVLSGARIVSIHPGYRPEDTAAGGYGVLIEYSATR